MHFPVQLGNFQLISIHDFNRNTPGLGSGFSYRGQNSKLEFYIYDWENPIVPDGVDSPTVKQAHDKAIIDVQRAAATQFYQNFQTLKTEQILIADHPYLHTSFSYKEDGHAKESHLLVSGFNTQIFKVRILTDRKLTDFLKNDRKEIYEHIGSLTDKARANGYAGVTFDQIKDLKTRLESVVIEDGLSPGEALTISQVELINRGHTQKWDLFNPVDIAMSSNSGYRAIFPSRANNLKDQTFAALIDPQGNVAIEETL